VVDVEFHADLELTEARRVLQRLGAKVISEGVEIEGPRGHALRRVNVWRVELAGEALRALAALDQVLSIQTARTNVTFNATSRTAINVDALNTAGLNGSGRTIGEWDGGWVDGDSVAPPTAPVGGVHPALTGQVRVRDHGPDSPPAVPGGCAASVGCAAPFCAFANHATHVGGTMIGDGALVGGGSGPNRGAANLAQLISYEWPDGSAELVCERQDAITNFSTVAHNNSWGYCFGCNSTLGFYDTLSSWYDQDIRTTPAATEVFAAGNFQNFRNSPIAASVCMGTPAVCPLPPLYAAPACAATPPGVPPPPALAAPPAAVTNRLYTVNAPGGTAKNVLTVGSFDAVNNRLSNFSGLGPMLDGRLKPEVVAHGQFVAATPTVTSTCVPGLSDGTGVCGATGYLTIGGTSMAAPAATGAVALLYERALALGIPFQSTDARALLAHTATDLGVHPGGTFLTVTGGQWAAFGGTDGPDFLTGYGRINALAARNHIDSGNVGGMLKPTGCPTGLTYTSIPFQSPVAVGGAAPVAGCPPMIWDVVWYVTVPAGMSEMKVTIAWNDPQATAGASPALVNDIDLMVEAPGGTYHYPWWLDPTCPYRQAVRVQSTTFSNAIYGDHRNNLEQVHVVGLAAGTWRIIVRTDGLASGPQPFSMMVSMN
jgi:hypothetical protein